MIPVCSNSDAIKSNRIEQKAHWNYQIALIQALYEQRHLSLALKSLRSIYYIEWHHIVVVWIVQQISGNFHNTKWKKKRGKV